MAFVTDKEVVKEHAQWRQPEMKAKIDTQTRMDPGAPFLVDGGGPVLSAWVAEKCKRISGKALAESEGRAHADLAQKAKVRELEAWGQFKVSSPEKLGAQSKDPVATRRALSWK